jgi:predicted small lipoprotein YifL
MQILVNWIALGLVVAALGGCGQKGVLYLPGAQPPAQARPSTASAPARTNVQPTSTGEASKPAGNTSP